MKKIYLALFLQMIVSSLLAQYPGGGGNQGGAQNMNLGHFYGKVVDEASGKGIEGASIQLSQNKLDPTTKKRKDFVVAVLLADKHGEFSIDKLSVIIPYQLSISAVGYKPYEQKVAFNLKMNGTDMTQMLNAVDRDLGN